MTLSTGQAQPITINKIGTETLDIPIVGTAPLIVHRFTEKAKRQMLDKMQGKRKVKEKRDPEDDYQGSFYRQDDGTYGFPVLAFKSATVSAARFFGKEVSMTGLRQTMFFFGTLSKSEGQQLVTIEGTPQMREDVVRIGVSGTDLRYRPEFLDWATTLRVTYVTSSLSRDSVLSLVDAGGLGVGVGEWRPERSGNFGTYQVDSTREIGISQ
jgi:hypothetical protein